MDTNDQTASKLGQKEMNGLCCVWEIPSILGEGPLWVKRENAIYWVDIVDKKVYRYGVLDGARRTWAFGQEVTSLATRTQGGFVCTVRDGFAFLDLESGAIRPIVLPETQLTGNRFNDGKVDNNGRFWAGSMDEGEKEASGTLYRLDPDLSLHTLDDDYIITNGPTFSIDQQTMYHTDTSKRVIYAFDLAENGRVANKRVFLQLEAEEEGYPDGMTIDSEDCLWLCHFAGSCISRYSPEGKLLLRIPMPVPNITSCTFARENLDTLYITTARYLMDDDALEQHPLAGSLFSLRPGVTGLPTPSFAG